MHNASDAVVPDSKNESAMPQLAVDSVSGIADGIGHSEPFAGLLPAASRHAHKVNNDWPKLFTHFCNFT